MANKFKKKKQADAGELKSLNTQVDFTAKATAFHGINTYGVVMVGDRGIEYYNERTLQDFIQIPWGEIDHIAAEVIGNKITRFAVLLKQGGHFAFSTRDNKATLRAVREYVGEDNLVRSASFADVIKAGVRGLGRRLTGRG
jgi:hypothetical protein